MNFSTISSAKTESKTTIAKCKSCFIFILLFLAIFFNFGCNKKNSNKTSKVQEKKAVKICSLSSSATAILLKLNHKIEAIDYFGQTVIKDPTLTVPIIGKGTLISFEKLVQLQITHVILWDYQKSIIPKLKEMNIEPIILPTFRLNDYPKIVNQLGLLIKKEEEATKLIKKFNQDIVNLKPILNKNNQTKVYFELYGENIIAGNNSYIGDLLKIANATSISNKTGIVSKEYVITQKPEVIFYIEGVTTASNITSRPGFTNLPAVKNKQIYPVKRDFIIEGAYPVEALNYLVSKLRK